VSHLKRTGLERECNRPEKEISLPPQSRKGKGGRCGGRGKNLKKSFIILEELTYYRGRRDGPPGRHKAVKRRYIILQRNCRIKIGKGGERGNRKSGQETVKKKGLVSSQGKKRNE